MAQQVRWRCDGCKRQWVYAHGWNVDDGCPACKGTSIRQVSYDAAFPGADYGDLRTDVGIPISTAPVAVVTPTPTVLANAIPEFEVHGVPV